jgi:hypothetical protein
MIVPSFSGSGEPASWRTKCIAPQEKSVQMSAKGIREIPEKNEHITTNMRKVRPERPATGIINQGTSWATKVTKHRMALTISIAKLAVKMTASERRRNRKLFNE